MSVGSIECFDVSPSQGQLLTIPRGNSLSLHRQRSNQRPRPGHEDDGQRAFRRRSTTLCAQNRISYLVAPFSSSFFFSFSSSLLLLLLTVVYGFLLDIKLKLERVNVYLIGD